MTTTPTPEEFLAQTDLPGTDEDDWGYPLTLEDDIPAMAPYGPNPLDSIAASMRQLVDVMTGGGGPAQLVTDLEAEVTEIEALHDAKQALIEEVLLICKPSTSKLANAIRAVLEPVVVPPAAEETKTSAETHGGYTSGPSLPSVRVMGGTPPADPVPMEPDHDADVEEWRAYARLAAPGATDVDQMNRSQIRTLLGIPQTA